MLKLGVALAMLMVFNVGGQTSETYRARLAEIEKDARDVNIQRVALEELITTTPAKVAQLEACGEELETLRSQLASINQNNLLKLLLRLSYEVYNTIDGTAGMSKTAVESFVNLGIHYTLGRIAFETAGAEGQKALGLDTSNYLGARNLAVRRVSEAAMTEINEVARINVALNRDLDYYRALVQAEQGSDPGETGAILRKNIVVREKIGLAIEALGRLRSTALAQLTVAQSDLEWLESEAESIASLHAGVKLQLEEALAEELTTAITAGVTNLQASLVEPPAPEPFTFSYPPDDPENPDPDYHHNYYSARYHAGANRIRNALIELLPELLSGFQRWTNDFQHIVTNNTATLLWVKERVQEWETKDQLPSDAFRAWHEAYYDLDYIQTTIAELMEKKQALVHAVTSLERLEPQLIAFNNLKRTAKGLETIAQDSAYTISEPVPEGQTPRPVLGSYSLERYLAEHGKTGLEWGEETLATLPDPLTFTIFFTYKEELHALKPQIDQSLENLAAAKESLRNHLSGLEKAYLAALADARAQQERVTDQTSILLQTLESAERLNGNKPYCSPSAKVEYLGIHTNFWNRLQLSEALATALQNNPRAGAARAVWEDYLNYIPVYQAIDRKYHTVAADLVRNFAGGSAITMLRTDLEAVHGTVNLLGMPAPQPSVESARLVEERYYEAYHHSREVRNRESARDLPECALLDPMPQDSGATNAYLIDPLVAALPVYGLVLIQEEMDRQFKVLMDKATRDEPAMWEVVAAIAATVDHWKLTHTNVALAHNFHNTAEHIKNEKLYEARMAWEAAFAAPVITSRPNYIAIPPGQQKQLTVQFQSHKPVACTWYRDNWFGEDEPVGTGPVLTLSAPSGLEQYYCILANAFGETHSGRIDVVPAQGPQIAGQPQSLTVETEGQAQLTTELYLTSAHVEQKGQWFVSLTADSTAPFHPIPGATGTSLHIKSVIASRWYYYEVRNPWGSTRSALAKVTTPHDQNPLLLTKGPLVAYLGVPFTHQLDGAYNTGFELAGTAPGWLSLDRTTGILRGTPSGAAGTSTTCPVRAVQETTSETNRSSTVTLQIALKASEEWEGPIALRYFTPEQAANPDIGGEEADPDNDGIPNKTEYALGLCPTCPDSNETKPLFLVSGNQAVMLLERSQERSSPYNIESSSDVGNWRPLGITGNVIQTQNGREGVSYNISTTNQGFLRLKTH